MTKFQSPNENQSQTTSLSFWFLEIRIYLVIGAWLLWNIKAYTPYNIHKN